MSIQIDLPASECLVTEFQQNPELVHIRVDEGIVRIFGNPESYDIPCKVLGILPGKSVALKLPEYTDPVRYQLVKVEVSHDHFEKLAGAVSNFHKYEVLQTPENKAFVLKHFPNARVRLVNTIGKFDILYGTTGPIVNISTCIGMYFTQEAAWATAAEEVRRYLAGTSKSEVQTKIPNKENSEPMNTTITVQTQHKEKQVNPGIYVPGSTKYEKSWMKFFRDKIKTNKALGSCDYKAMSWILSVVWAIWLPFVVLGIQKNWIVFTVGMAVLFPTLLVAYLYNLAMVYAFATIDYTPPMEPVEMLPPKKSIFLRFFGWALTAIFYGALGYAACWLPSNWSWIVHVVSTFNNSGIL